MSQKLRRQAKLLAEIQSLRKLQCTLAEVSLAHAQTLQIEAQARLESSLEAQNNAAHGWQSAVSAPHFEVGLVATWRAHLETIGSQCTSAEAHRQFADRNLEQHSEATRIAHAFHDAAASMARRAKHQLAQNKDERRLQNVEDQYPHRKGAHAR